MIFFLHAAGATRIPGIGCSVGGSPVGPSKHWLTDFYGRRFNLPVQDFNNVISKGYYYFGGQQYSVEGKKFFLTVSIDRFNIRHY